MAKELIEIKGFKELQQKLKKLGNDKDKRRTVLAILRKAARSTIKAAKTLSPVSKRPMPKKSKAKKKRQEAGTGKKSIKFQVMRRAKNPMGIVGPRSTGKYDGWYIRKFVIPGHNVYRAGFKRSSHEAGYADRKWESRNKSGDVKGRTAPNYFMDRAKRMTQGRVANSAVPSMEKFIQRKIDQL